MTGLFFFLSMFFILIVVTVSAAKWSDWRNEEIIIGREKIEVVVTRIYPPKHVYVDLRELGTGRIFEKVYVSKHYNNWRNIQLQKPFYAEREFYRNPNSETPDVVYVRWIYGSVLAGVKSITL